MNYNNSNNRQQHPLIGILLNELTPGLSGNDALVRAKSLALLRELLWKVL